VTPRRLAIPCVMLLTLPAAGQEADAAVRKAAALARLKKLSIAPSRESLQAAALAREAALVIALLDAGVDPNAEDPRLPRSVLSLAAVVGCQDKDADPEARDAVVAALLAGGADPNAVEPGQIPLFVYVAQQCPRPVVEAFLKAGARLDARTPQGFTPLSMALIVGNLDAAEALLDHGARLSPEARAKLFPEPPTDPRLAALVKRAAGPPPKNKPEASSPRPPRP